MGIGPEGLLDVLCADEHLAMVNILLYLNCFLGVDAYLKICNVMPWCRSSWRCFSVMYMVDCIGNLGLGTEFDLFIFLLRIVLLSI